MSNYVPGIGPSGAKIMIVGEAPGKTEDELCKPFVGPSGEMLDSCFKDTELGKNWRDHVYLTNVYKFRPPNNIIKRIGEVCNPLEQIEQLWNEIQTVNPNVIIATGGVPLKILTGEDKILTYRGSIMYNQKLGLPKVIPTIHPANLVRASNDSGDYFSDKGMFKFIWKRILSLDLQKAINESKSRELHLPERLLRYAKSSVDVFRFIRENKNRLENLHADIETYGSIVPACIAIGFDRYEALSIPLFKQIGSVELTSMAHTELAFIWQKLYELFKENLVSGQNWKFDQVKMETLGFKFKGLRSDTMLKAHTVMPELPRKSQEFLASIYTREPYYKDEGREFSWGHHPVERLYLYNAKDVAVDTEIDDELEIELKELSEQYHINLVKFYYDHVVPQHEIYMEMEKTGFDVDEEQLQFLQIKYDHWLDCLAIRLYAETGREINYNSPQQVSELLFKQLALPTKGIPFGKKHYKGDEEVISKLLKGVTDEHRQSILNGILESRRVGKTKSTYLYCGRDYDRRVRSEFRITGTENGRSSTGVIKPPVRPFEVGFAYQTLTKHGDIGQDIRSYLLPARGYVFVNVDLSQAEARVVAALSKDWALLEAFDKIDIHRRTAGLVLISGSLNLNPGPDPTDKIGKESPERFIGKKTRHAGNYDMGWKTFQSAVTADCRRFGINYTMTPYKAKLALERFHKASPNIREIFHREVQDEIDTKRVLINPFDRIRIFTDRIGHQLYKESYAFIPQSTVKDRLIAAAIQAKKVMRMEKGIHFRFNGESHDALLFQVKEQDALDFCHELKPIIETPIDFNKGSLKRDVQLVIPSEFEMGDNYLNMEKVKL